MGGAIFVLETFSDDSPPDSPSSRAFILVTVKVEVGLVSTRHKPNAS